MNNLKKILLKIEKVENMHQKIRLFFYISKKNEIAFTIIIKSYDLLPCNNCCLIMNIYR